MYDYFLNKSKNIGSFVSFLNNNKNKEYLDYLNNSIPIEIVDRTIPEKIWYLLNNSELQLCNCGEHLSFIGFKNGYRKSCGRKECYVNSRKETCLEKYGVDNPKKSKEIIEKEQNDILEKWNGQHYMKNLDIKEKVKQSMIDNWGVEFAQQSDVIKKKSLESWQNNPNRDDIIRDKSLKNKSKTLDEKEEIDKLKKKTIIKKFGSYENFIEYRLDKIKEKSLEKYGVEHHFMDKEIVKKRIYNYKKNITNKILNKLPNDIIYIDRKQNLNLTDSYIQLKCNKCNSDFDISRQSLVNRTNINSEICLICNPISSGTSKMELDLLDFIKDNYSGEILHKERITKKELDIYLPELKLAFEFNGLYWHSNALKENNYHLEKTNEYKDIGIKIVHIWEDDWLYKNDIVKSIILNKIGSIKDKIYARKCIIKEVDNKSVREFLSKNHLQGFVGSKIKIGLYYNDELVSLMTFGALRKSLGSKSTENKWELLRFCNKINNVVIGGASKLFKHFIDNYVFEEITSFCDNSRSDGNLYEKLGFRFKYLSIPGYYYIIDGIRKHRFNYRKDKLVRLGYDKNMTEFGIMDSLGINRIYDCGEQKWIFLGTKS
jgi:hypothetical protein